MVVDKSMGDVMVTTSIFAVYGSLELLATIEITVCFKANPTEVTLCNPRGFMLLFPHMH